jgi:hypothetical protein
MVIFYSYVKLPEGNQQQSVDLWEILWGYGDIVKNEWNLPSDDSDHWLEFATWKDRHVTRIQHRAPWAVASIAVLDYR